MIISRRSDIVARTRNHRLAAWLGGAGAVAGCAAGLLQLTIGSSIPEWTGAKSSPGPLGLLTIALSLLAGYAALRQRDIALTTGHRTAYAVMIFATALLCFTTVGWLWWWLPAPLLFAAGSLTIDNGHDSLRAVRENGCRCLLTVLGGYQLLMAAGAGPLLMAVGGLSGAGRRLGADDAAGDAAGSRPDRDGPVRSPRVGCGRACPGDADGRGVDVAVAQKHADPAGARSP